MSSNARQVVLVALLLAAVLGLFVAAESGQRRLEDASRHVQHAAQRQVALADVWQLVRQAESSQTSARATWRCAACCTWRLASSRRR